MRTVKLMLLSLLLATAINAGDDCQRYDQGTEKCISQEDPTAAPLPWLPSPCEEGKRLLQGTTNTCDPAVPIEAAPLQPKPSCEEGQRLVQGTEGCEVFNMAPVADAGTDQNVSTSSLVTLDGRMSHDPNGDPLTYRWTFRTRPAGSSAEFSDPLSATPLFTADTEGTYVAELTVSDDEFDSPVDEVTIIASSSNTNTPPVAHAGGNQNVYVGFTVRLDGSGSTDAESDPLDYSWNMVSKPAGSEASLSDVTAPSPTFTADLAGEYRVHLIVNDGQANSAKNEAIVTAVIPPPVDTVPPLITLNGDNPVIVIRNTVYEDAGATAVDDVDGNIPVTVGEWVNTGLVGNHTVFYIATDSSGNVARLNRTVKVIDTFDLVAYDDLGEPAILGEATVNVLANDTTNTGDVTISWVSNNGSVLHTGNGTWTILSDNNVKFTPNSSFGGGLTFTVQYKITDTNGNEASAFVTIKYPVIFKAEADSVLSNTTGIEPVTIDVLLNDTTVVDSPATVSWPDYYNGSSTVETSDGNWSIEDNKVIFTPAASFGGGRTWRVTYQITDDNGYISTALIEIGYPNIFKALPDGSDPENIEEVTVKVLENDIYANGTVVTLRLKDYDDDWNLVYVEEVETSDGNWTVMPDNTVKFTPVANYGGGSVWMQYQISGDGYVSESQISINYPQFIYAEYDHKEATALGEAVTVDVLANDTITGTLDGTPLLIDNQNGQPEYVTEIVRYEGTWSVAADDSVTFTPDPNVNLDGQWIYAEYRIKDTDGRTSSTWINIEYPKYFYAEYDNAQADTIDPVTVNVLENDTYPVGSTITVLLQYLDENWNTVYVDSYETSDGIWSVTSVNTIEFVPSATFGGGYVSANYRITDLHERTSETGINIEFPKVVYAEYDERYPDSLASETVNVLGNDFYDEESSVTVMLENHYWDENDNFVVEYVTFVEKYDGNWSVTVNNEVEFTPSENFDGPSASMTYQITQDGRTSTTSVDITYPIIIQALSDYEPAGAITEVTIDVLNNDTITNGLDRLELYNWDDNVYSTSYETPEGNWSVTAENNVLFTPSETFGGGYVQVDYRITDTLKNSAQTSIGIEYDVILKAWEDFPEYYSTSDIATIDVLLNDEVTLGKDTATVELITGYDVNGNPTLGLEVSQPDGIWSIDDQNNAIFTPNNEFNGGLVYVNYQVTDSEGHKSSASVELNYI